MFKFVECITNNSDNAVIHTDNYETIYKKIKNNIGKTHYAEKIGMKWHLNDGEEFFVKPYFDIDIKYIETSKEAIDMLKDKNKYIQI